MAIRLVDYYMEIDEHSSFFSSFLPMFANWKSVEQLIWRSMLKELVSLHLDNLEGHRVLTGSLMTSNTHRDEDTSFMKCTPRSNESNLCQTPVWHRETRYGWLVHEFIRLSSSARWISLQTNIFTRSEDIDELVRSERNSYFPATVPFQRGTFSEIRIAPGDLRKSRSSTTKKRFLQLNLSTERSSFLICCRNSSWIDDWWK